MNLEKTGNFEYTCACGAKRKYFTVLRSQHLSAPNKITANDWLGSGTPVLGALLKEVSSNISSHPQVFHPEFPYVTTSHASVGRYLLTL